MICHCDACHYTFEAAHFHCEFGVPAVRTATEEEIEEYIEEQQVVMEDLAEEPDVRMCG